MKRFVRQSVLFVLLLLLISTALDWVVTSGLRKTEAADYGEWNDIITGEAESELLIQGSSRAWLHFSPSIIGAHLGMTCYNLGIDGYGLQMQLTRYALYLKYAQRPKVIVQELSPFSLEIREGIWNPGQFLPYFDEEAIRDGVRPYNYFKWYDRYLPLARYRGEPRVCVWGVLEFLGIRHYASGKDRGYWGKVAEWSDDLSEFIRKNPDGINRKVSPAILEALDEFLTDCEREGVFVVLVYPPEYFKARELVNNREEILATYRSLAQKHGVALLDYSYDAICYDTQYFYNSQHMNRLGAELFSTRFAETLAQLVHSSRASKVQGREP